MHSRFWVALRSAAATELDWKRRVRTREDAFRIAFVQLALQSGTASNPINPLSRSSRNLGRQIEEIDEGPCEIGLANESKRAACTVFG